MKRLTENEKNRLTARAHHDQTCAGRATSFRKMANNPVFTRSDRARYERQAQEWDRKGGKG